MRGILSILFILIIFASFGQSSRKQRRAESSQQSGPTSLDPSPEEQRHLPKQSKKRSDSRGPTYNGEKEFYERVEAFAKTRRKNERMLMTPQYSDPSYFGHKRPPKRRPPNKMKFCKECGIRH
jgi:hypothetical protein